MYPFKLCFSMDTCPGVGLLDHMVVLFLAFQGCSILFSIMADQCTSPPVVSEGSLPVSLEARFSHVINKYWLIRPK